MVIPLSPPGCPLPRSRRQIPVLHRAVWTYCQGNDAQPLRSGGTVCTATGFSQLRPTDAAFSVGTVGRQGDGLWAQGIDHPQNGSYSASGTGARPDVSVWWSRSDTSP